MRSFEAALLATVALAHLASPSAASAQALTVCVSVEVTGVAETARRGLLASLRSLVSSELDRHAGHRSADGDCDSRLAVELVALDGERFVTGRIGIQVPHREQVEDGLPSAVERLLRVVLHSDPLVLRDPDEEGGLGSAVRRLASHGQTLFGVELFERVAMVDGRVQALPGVGLRLRREMLRWHVALRLAVATRAAPRTERLSLRNVTDLSAELGWFFSAEASTSGYLVVALGLEHQFLRGPLRDDPNRRDEVHGVGLTASVRLGVELFRSADTRLDVFAELTLPAFVTRDELERVMRQWVPSLVVGVGVMF